MELFPSARFLLNLALPPRRVLPHFHLPKKPHLFSLLSVIAAELLFKRMDSQNYQIAAQQQQVVANAAAKYIKDNFNAVLASATPTVPAQITVQMLRNTNYLSSGFSDTNAFGQTFIVLARSPTANQPESIVITTGGDLLMKSAPGKLLKI